MKTKTPNILVTGDVTMDHNLFHLPAPQSSYTEWNDEDQARVCSSEGGACLLGELIAESASQLGTASDKQIPVSLPDTQAVGNKEDSMGHSFAVWTPHTVTSDPKCKDRVWRVEKFLGMNARTAPLPAATADASPAPTVLVINDAHLGFSNNQSAWPECLSKGNPPRWILLKVSRLDLLGNDKEPNPLWAYLQEIHADRLVIHMTVDSLREKQIQISRGISWERTAQDLLWELRYRLFGQPLLAKHTTWRCAHVIVSMNSAAAFIYSPVKCELNEGRASLVFSPKTMEGEWEAGYPGKVIGSASCFSATLALALAANPENPELEKAACAALQGVRALHRNGYGKVDPAPATLVCPKFPFAEIATIITNAWKGEAPARPEDVFVTSKIPDKIGQQNDESAGATPWSFLTEDALKLATEVVMRGTGKALSQLPMASIGGLETADRREIEGFRGIGNLLREYIEKRDSKPLSIAVFGPPGSGKSFGVKEIARGLSRNAEIKTFNLSQFGGPAELIAALHQVRDVGLSGKLPVIFWDEFDAKLNDTPLGWLRYFLEPMQDGTFLEGQVTHPIGHAIFVFAGGTRASFQQFSHPEKPGDFKEAKGPDFVSRLRGFLNILGPNPIDSNPTKDPGYVIRRSILLRSMITRGYPGLLNGKKLMIDEGVVRAFLKVGAFLHGARSMESILAASTLNGKTFFGRSCLPPLAQLNLNVNGLEFQALVEEMDGLENLAQAMHENYCNRLRGRGYKHGPESNEEKKVSEALVPYDELPDHLRKENMAAASALPEKLAAVGYAILPAREGLTHVEFPTDVIDRLAEIEHDRWLRSKLRGGWKYGEVRKNEEKIHSAMLPWNEITPEVRASLYPEAPENVGLMALPEQEREKDRDQFAGLSAMLAKYGCSVVRLSSASAQNPR